LEGANWFAASSLFLAPDRSEVQYATSRLFFQTAVNNLGVWQQFSREKADELGLGNHASIHSSADKASGIANLAFFRCAAKEGQEGKMPFVVKKFTDCQYFLGRLDKIQAPQQLATFSHKRFALTRFTSWL
jgi:hypothetical protein